MDPEVPNRPATTCKAMIGKAGFRQALPKFVQVAAFLFVLAVGPVFAKTHPVPLDKNVDAAKCLECHEDKSKGKAVHSAIATGCLSCHEVRVNRDVTRVKLTTTTTQALCLSCHDPHESDNPNQLLKATTGATRDDNLCLSCHNTGVNVPKDGSRHAALDMGCDTCHLT